LGNVIVKVDSRFDTLWPVDAPDAKARIEAGQSKWNGVVCSGVTFTEYKLSNKVDEFGNQFRYRAKVKDYKGEHLGRWAWDVFLLTP
jgi:hypothetical protein